MIKKMLTYSIDLLKRLCYSLIRVGKYMGWINMKSKYSALEIATWFIYKTNAEKKENQSSNDQYEVYEGLTHLKLQKLLYYAQGISLAKTGNELFNDNIEAWEHGPVVKKVYNVFTTKGRNEITIEDAPCDVEIIRKIELDSNARNILNLTYDNFAIYTAWQLRNMTHQSGTPWRKTYMPSTNKKIPNELIKEYFIKEILE